MLIMDGHGSHTKNLDVIKKARENNVILISLPSHCTHKLQPLDIAFFKSMNTYYDQEVQAWLRRHAGRVVTELQVAEIFSAAYGKAATVQNACNGFRKAGIVPFRRDLFTDEDYAASAITDVPLETSHPPDFLVNHSEPAGKVSYCSVLILTVLLHYCMFEVLTILGWVLDSSWKLEIPYWLMPGRASRYKNHAIPVCFVGCSG